MEHDHVWVGMTVASSRLVQRYRCEECGCWGWRGYRPRDKKGVQLYRRGGGLVFDPLPSWLDDGGERRARMASKLIRDLVVFANTPWWEK